MNLAYRTTIEGIDNNKYYRTNTTHPHDVTAMPNCTAYVYGRMQEVLEEQFANDLIRKPSGYGNANTWWNTTKLVKSDKPRNHSIVVVEWGQYGHVAYIENVLDNGNCLITHSRYNANKNLRDWRFFDCFEQKLKVGEMFSNIGRIIGFIYLPISEDLLNFKKYLDNQEVNQEVKQETKKEPLFKVGDIVVPTKLVDYNGTTLKTWDKQYIITELVGDRAVLCAERNGKQIVWCAINIANIKKI